ncbi:MAG: Transketolase [Chloroflexi bacterium ADurb.Bin180]|nr:MAG: Transketolase [Chloroflexi bacterium ADurb.Bin180]
MDGRNLDALCINTIRTLAMDMVEQAQSGHPGMPMGAATMAYVLWTRFLRHNPADPSWPDRDRFVLSAGHGCALLYALLHLTGYNLPLEQLERFRQWGSLTPGHPERGLVPGVETTTGPLGQGFATGVGMAIAERMLAARFNRPGYELVNHDTYGIVSDGDLMEGISSEAASLAGHLKLGRLTYLYDDNRITIEGSTSLSFTEDVAGRFAAYGWFVQKVNGNDIEQLTRALETARFQHDQPSLIIARTHIAYGSPHKQDSAAAHGAPLGADEVRRTKEALGWPPDSHFWVPPEALAHFRLARECGAEGQRMWEQRLAEYRGAYPELASEWDRRQRGELPKDWEAALPFFGDATATVSTREASGQVLNSLASLVPELVGGSADLAPSNNTYLKGEGEFSATTPQGRNLHFGVREHAMGAILSGLAAHGGLRPYGGTFLVFSDYMRAAIRLAAMMHLPVVYVFTHDSIGLGEDGPTHQPVEHLAALRAMPNLTVLRPADANETVAAWRWALEHRDGPTALVLSRQKLPVLDRKAYAPASGLERGAYILTRPAGGEPRLILIATGSEVSLALAVSRELESRGVPVQVVSMPGWELFAAQPPEYQKPVLPDSAAARMSIEAGSSFGWHRWLGTHGEAVALDRFGASAPGEVLLERLGFSVGAIVNRALRLIESTPQ